MQPPSPITPPPQLPDSEVVWVWPTQVGGRWGGRGGGVRAARILTFAAFFCLRLSPSFPSSFNTSYLFFLQNSLSTQVCSHLPLSAASVVHSAPCCLPLSLSLRGAAKKKKGKKKEKRRLRIILSQRSAISKTGGLSLRFASFCPKYKAGDRKQCSGLWTASNPLLRDSRSFPQTLIGLFADSESFSDCSQGKLRF